MTGIIEIDGKDAEYARAMFEILNLRENNERLRAELAQIKTGWATDDVEPATCPDCGQMMQKEAHDIGDGWALAFICSNPASCNAPYQAENIIPWPFGDSYISGKDLEILGYTVV